MLRQKKRPNLLSSASKIQTRKPPNKPAWLILINLAGRVLDHPWHHHVDPIENAAFDRDLELAVFQFAEIYRLVFPCRRVRGGWTKAASNDAVKVYPTLWRKWETK